MLYDQGKNRRREEGEEGSQDATRGKWTICAEEKVTGR
jgi:hypothetical protein